MSYLEITVSGVGAMRINNFSVSHSEAEDIAAWHHVVLRRFTGEHTVGFRQNNSAADRPSDRHTTVQEEGRVTLGLR